MILPTHDDEQQALLTATSRRDDNATARVAGAICSGSMMSRSFVVAAVCLTGCPPPPMEAHDAADALRANPHRIGTVSRQELASDVTDPDSTVGTAAKPAPVVSNTTVKIIGMVQSKICFLVEDTNIEARDEAEKIATYHQKMNSARYAAIALRANGLSGKAPWPQPAATAMIKVRDSNPSDSVSAVVCLPAPVLEDDSKLIVLTMEWPSSEQRRLLAMWELTQ